MTDEQPILPLADGTLLPQLGLGLWRTPDEEATGLVRRAIEAGYRLFDTAAAYGNERGVGEGVRAAGAESEVFVTTKLWNEDQGYDRTLRAFDESLRRLGLPAIDLYLIHWPAPSRGLYVESWRALIRLKEEGRARSIGVSNFGPEHLARITRETGEIPVVNQIELHPRFQQLALRAINARLGVRTQSWSPLGQGRLLHDLAVSRIAARYGKTPAQVIIRWHLDNGLIVIPKSANPERIRENIGVFDFRLTPEDQAQIASLDRPDGRIGPDPTATTF
ncbi:aldo/keto reductase [Cupriavidus oxalaticus]|uniref:Aldo/keto reductase n=1 Tax=Cupriavidus oxalaticus TaxID=96344 RepID=A0A4P7LVC8_9BURK|nr:aldo/keto reductase [Cupriavidus oxalaticus]QBY56431.1 aldo/keto reductase [Cupriavidus oxalaticus]